MLSIALSQWRALVVVAIILGCAAWVNHWGNTREAAGYDRGMAVAEAC